jgi:Rod binding domain-containing protein
MADGGAFGSASGMSIEPLTAQTDKLLHQVSSATKDNGKIDQSAKDFESILLGSWLQQAEQSFAQVPGGDEEGDDDGGKDQYMSLAMESMGKSMAASGGIGIGKMIASQLHKSEAHHSNAAKPEPAE